MAKFRVAYREQVHENSKEVEADGYETSELFVTFYREVDREHQQVFSIKTPHVLRIERED
jgi:hypothetical protein